MISDIMGKRKSTFNDARQGELFPVPGKTQKINFSGEIPPRKRRFASIRVLTARAANIRRIRQRREENESYQLVIKEMNEKFGEPTTKNIVEILEKLRQEVRREVGQAESFRREGPSEKDFAEGCELNARLIGRYIESLIRGARKMGLQIK